MLALHHFWLDFIISCCGALQPWVAYYISHANSILRWFLNHHGDQALEVFREIHPWVSLLLNFPEYVILLLSKETVDFIIFFCSFPRIIASMHHEQSNPTSEQVSCRSWICFVPNLRCHVIMSTTMPSKDTRSIFSLNTAHKTIVKNFQAEVLFYIDKNIIWLQISMAQIFVGVEIFETLEHLSEVISAYFLTESSSFL